MTGTLYISNANDFMLLSASTNDRYLVNENGTPVLLVGTSSWGLITGLTKAETDTYLADRINRGNNAILVQLIDHYYADNAPANADLDEPFTGTDFITPNEDYFAHADYVIGKARDLGVYVLLAPLYLGSVLTEQGWDTEVDAASTDDMTDWGEYVGNRYKDYDNIIWVMSGDRNPTDYMTKLNAFMTGLQTYASQLVTIHNNRNSEAFTYVQPTWLSLNNIYTLMANTNTWAEDAYARSPTIPFFQIEATYEDDSYGSTHQEVRAQSYWTILGGGLGGAIYGHNTLYYFSTGWADLLDDTGSVGLNRFSDFFNAIAWQTLVPDWSHGFLESGYGTLGNADYAGAAINAAGTLGVIYMPSNRTMTVDMSLFAGSVTCRWFDPFSGQYEVDAASPHANSGTHDFSHAGANDDGDADWILLLEA